MFSSFKMLLAVTELVEPRLAVPESNEGEMDTDETQIQNCAYRNEMETNLTLCNSDFNVKLH